MLGLPWNKDDDTLAAEIPSELNKLTKRTILHKLGSIYDPLRIISPTTIIRKITYCDACDSKLSWDDELLDWIIRKWKKWKTKLPTKVKVPRSSRLSKEPLNLIDIHVFGDATTSDKNYGKNCYWGNFVFLPPSSS